MTLYTQQSSNTRKTWLLMSVFFLVVIGIGYFFSYYYQNPSILILFVIFHPHQLFLEILAVVIIRWQTVFRWHMQIIKMRDLEKQVEKQR